MPRKRNIAAVVAALVALTALALAGSAGADYHDVIRDCNDDGQLSHHWPPDDLKKARDNLPTDIREYSDCLTLINAELAKLGGAGSGPGGSAGGGTGGGAATTDSGAAGTPAAVSALRAATGDALRSKPSITAGGQTLRPAASGLNGVPGAANEIPSALLAAVVAVIVLCALGGIAAGWRLWPALARVPLRLFRR